MSFPTLIIEPLAESDVEAIFEHIHRNGPEGTVRWYQAFRTAAQRATETPDSYSLAPEEAFLNRGVRNFFFKTRRGHLYRVLFLVLRGELRVLRVRGPGQPELTQVEVLPE